MTPAAAEHGILALSSPWARAGIPASEREAIAAAIPAGYQVGVSGHAHGGGRSFIVWGIGPEGPIAGLRWEHRSDPVYAARQMAERLQALAVGA